MSKFCIGAEGLPVNFGSRNSLAGLFMYTISKLKNGLKLASHSLANTRSVAIGVWVGVGGRYEPEVHSGISHFFEHCVFKGTRRRSYRQIKESIEGVGGQLNGFTSEEVTCFLAKVLTRHVPLACDVLLDMVLDPRLSPRDVEKERRVIIEEIKMYNDLPQHVAYDRLLQLLWPGHPLGRNLAGNFSSLSHIGCPELRAHQARYCGADNLLISACGNITHATLMRHVNGVLRQKSPELVESGTEKFLPLSVKQEQAQVVFESKNTQQTHLCLGFHAPRRDAPQRYAVTLLHIILGANMSSRLFNEVREKKGYAYEIGTSLRKFNDGGAFVVHAGVVNEKAAAAGGVIVNELRRICDQAVGDDELKRAKDYYVGQFTMGLEDNSEHMIWLGENIMTRGKPEYPAGIIRGIQRVGKNEVRDAARMIFKTATANLAIVGPYNKNSRDALEALVREM
ncbi:MAG: pitrilysin family protein [Candidatus Omnitrophica bacterium]|nr:pitrilysin family protein [Candidatus Omnitrophota bacterium]